MFSWTLTTHGKYSVSGDEPHYLMISESLRTDGDLDLSNNYAQNDGRLFGQDNLPIELHALPSKSGELRSIHGLGIAVFVLPAYTVGQLIASSIPESRLQRFRMSRGLFVYSIVGLSLMAMTALGIALMTIGLTEISGRRLALLAGVAVGMSPPVVSHSFLVFPESFALFVSCCTVWFVTKRPADHDQGRLLVLLFGIGMLPWFHQKYLLYTCGLLVVIWLRRRDVIARSAPLQRLVGASLFIAPQIAVLLWLRHEWGSFGGALTIGALAKETIPLTPKAFSQGAIGLLFDRQSGLAPYTPLFWLVVPCLVLTWKRSWDLLVPFALLYLPAASFVIGWWAGFSPAARYLVPSVPLLAIPVVYSLRYRIVRYVALPLLIWQLVLDAAVWQHPRWLWPVAEGFNPVLDALWLPGRLYGALLAPVRASGLNEQALIPIALTIALSTVVAVLARREHPVDARA
jgi:hypothetical protein